LGYISVAESLGISFHSFIYLHSSKNIIHNKMYVQDNNMQR